MKKVLLLALVVVLAIIGLPLPVGAAGTVDMGCGGCDQAPLADAACVAVLAAAGMALSVAVRPWASPPWADTGVHLRFRPDRPPQGGLTAP